MSNPPSDHDPSPEFGWSLPPEDSPLPPPPPPRTVVPEQPPPMPPPAPPRTTGFGGPPGNYIPGPLTSSPIDAILPAPVPEPRSTWKRWWVLAAILAVLVGAGAIVLAGRDGDDAPDDAVEDTRETRDTEPDETDATDETDETEVTTAPSSDPSTATTEQGIPPVTDSLPDVPGTQQPPADLPVVGETVTLADGTVVRVNEVVHDAPATQDFLPPSDGNVLTRISFEVCAGSEGFAALNPLYWVATLSDGTEATPFLFSFPILVLQLAPGACARTQIDMEGPQDQPVATVGARDQIFQLIAEWSTAERVKVDGPLAAGSPVAAAPVGTAIDLDDGGRATVRSITPGVEPLDTSQPPSPGYVVVRVDVEVCAASADLAVSSQSFFGFTTDHAVGAASFSGSTLPTEPVAAGQCASGLLDLEMPEGTMGDVVLADEQFIEAARWRVG